MKNKYKLSFTLVELLIVISIIAVLAAILFPVIRGAIIQAEKSRAKTEVNSIKNAVMAYYAEYGILPYTGTSSPSDDSNDENSQGIIGILIGTNTDKNPRGITFLELNTGKTDGTFEDPWGNQYTVSLDYTYDGRVSGKATKVIVKSAGPSSATADDDITTLKKEN